MANHAFWQDKPDVPGEIRESELPAIKPGDRKVLIKVHAWAVNPCDSMLQQASLDPASYPMILGCDVAGTVEAVDDTATSEFRVGDRVFGFTANRGFQDYVILEDRLMAKIQGDMAFREAVVLSLCATTSALGLFSKTYLSLDYPKLGVPKKGQSVLVWGGSSAVGSNAIQLATAAGYDVITTCGTHNFDYVKNLGAVKAFDYKDPDVAEKLAAELDKGSCAGIYMAAGSNEPAFKVAAACKNKPKFASSNPINEKEVPEGVEAKVAVIGSVRWPDVWFEITDATFGGYLPEALAKGVYKIAPPPQVVNTKGLEGIQEAIDLMKKGVSGTKLVVERRS